MEVHAKKIRSVADYMCCSILDQMQQVISEKKVGVLWKGEVVWL